MELFLPDKDEDWHYEGPDYSVGIFGEGWVHDACYDSENYDGSDIDTIETMLFSWTSGFGMNRGRYWLYQFSCTGCGAVMYQIDSDYDPDFSHLPDHECENCNRINTQSDYWQTGGEFCGRCDYGWHRSWQKVDSKRMWELVYGRV